MAPRLPLLYLGHSLGGQVLGVLPDAGRVRAALTVTAGSGYYKLNDRMRRRVRILWFAAIPALTPLCGYFPGARLRKVGDLPKGVVLQWRRWCLDPRYHVGAEGPAVREQFEAVRFPLVALSLTDDELMTERGTRVLVDCYANAPRRVERVAPADVAARRIGHFGFFRDAFAPTLWARTAGWLNEFNMAKETTT